MSSFDPPRRIFALALGLCSCTSPPDALEDHAGSVADKLYQTGAAWPSAGGTTSIPTCWSAGSQAMTNFAEIAPRLQRIVEDSWGAVANVQFTGWAACPDSTGGMVVVNLNTSGSTSATLGFQGSGATHVVNVDVRRGDLFGGVLPHEFGHILGFAEEMSRPDFTPESVSCSQPASPGGDTHGTPPDRMSIMAATGYCQANAVLSYHDRTGVQSSVYGRRTRFVRDPSPDGNFLADLLFFRQSDASTFIAASTGSGFEVRLWSEPEFGGDRNNFYHGDFDGDQILDFGYFETGDSSFHVATSSAYGMPGPGSGRWIAAGQFGHPGGRHHVGDYDGDGRDDLGYFEPTDATFHVSLSTGTTFAGAGSGAWIDGNAFGTKRDNLFAADFNGDGITDLGYQEDGDHSFHVTLSTGAGFGGAGSGRWVDPGRFGHSGGRYFPADYDGDGKDDLGFFEPGDGSFHVALSTGAGFGAPGSGRWIAPGGFGGKRDNYYPADFDGDRAVDLGYLDDGDNSFHVSLSTGAGFGGTGSGQWLAPNAMGQPEGGRFFVTSTRRR